VVQAYGRVPHLVQRRELVHVVALEVLEHVHSGVHVPVVLCERQDVRHAAQLRHQKRQALQRRLLPLLLKLLQALLDLRGRGRRPSAQ
jgi:hypothetical protein